MKRYYYELMDENQSQSHCSSKASKASKASNEGLVVNSMRT